MDDGKWCAPLVDGEYDSTHHDFIKELYPIGRILLYIKEHKDLGKNECCVGRGDEPGTIYAELTRRGFTVVEVESGFHIRW